VAANTQVCDVIVTLNAKRQKVYVQPSMPPELSTAFSQLVVLQIEAMKAGKNYMQVGKSYSWEKPEYEYTFYVTKKDQYKVCFHCKTVEDEDPV